MITELIKKWLTAFLVKLIGLINPGLAAETDAAFKARDEKKAEDAATLKEVAVIENQVITREAEVAVDQAVIEKNTADIADLHEATTQKLKRVEDATTIEEVLNIK